MQLRNVPSCRRAWLEATRRGELGEASPVGDARIDRRIVLRAAGALATAGPAVLRAQHAEAQPRPGGARALFAYVGAFTTPERKGHGGGINVYRVDPASGAWSHEQLLEIANPSFLALDPSAALSLRGPCRPRRGQRLCDRQANRAHQRAQPAILRR